jgi:hypothetical protein
MDNDIPVETQQVNVKLPRSLASAVKVLANQRGMTLNEFYEQAVRAFLLQDASGSANGLREEQARLAQAQAELDVMLSSILTHN